MGEIVFRIHRCFDESKGEKMQILNQRKFALTERGQQAFSTFSLSVNQCVLDEGMKHLAGYEE